MLMRTIPIQGPLQLYMNFLQSIRVFTNVQISEFALSLSEVRQVGMPFEIFRVFELTGLVLKFLTDLQYISSKFSHINIISLFLQLKSTCSTSCSPSSHAQILSVILLFLKLLRRPSCIYPKLGEDTPGYSSDDLIFQRY